MTGVKFTTVSNAKQVFKLFVEFSPNFMASQQIFPAGLRLWKSQAQVGLLLKSRQDQEKAAPGGGSGAG